MALSISTDLPTTEKSTWVKPVILPPGRAMLAMKPCATGSLTPTKITGINDVARFSAPIAGVPLATITSGLSATTALRFLASARRCRPPSAHRFARCALRASRASRGLAGRRSVDLVRGYQSLLTIITAMRRTACWARTASGQHTAPPSRIVKSRRRISPHKVRVSIISAEPSSLEVADVRVRNGHQARKPRSPLFPRKRTSQARLACPLQCQ